MSQDTYSIASALRFIPAPIFGGRPCCPLSCAIFYCTTSGGQRPYTFTKREREREILSDNKEGDSPLQAES